MIVYLNIMQNLAAKGWTSYRLRNEKVLPESVLTRLRQGRPVTTETIDKLCELLECQPGEILKWEPGE
ncbi:MAG: helix-turn-helix domain-containing protein [Firmicutes bacterium]|nr:helix-turn-helix domain-containing protein [Bacillota bacterium]